MVFCRQFTDLGVQRFHIDRWLRRCGAVRAKNIRSSVLELRFPCCDLIGVNVELFS
jgi:hypothetical protein